MVRWTLASCLLISASAFAHAHSNELLYKLKAEKDSWGIQKLVISDKSDLNSVRKLMLATGKYQFVVPNSYETLPSGEERTDVSNQWHHETIQSVDAWSVMSFTKSVTVAVCDSGVQSDHEDLEGQLLPGRNLVDDVNDNSTTTSHGTFVAGLIAAKADSVGVAGVSPGVKILPLRISDANGGTSMELILKCIKYAADAGARVINVSFTGVENAGVQAAGEYANDKGALLVYAAGNKGYYRSALRYPDYRNVMVVGATSSDDTRWKWYIDAKNRGGSNYGPFIDLMAPGHQLYSTTIYTPEERYRVGSGTSYAAPIVSGVAALLFSINPRFTPQQVERMITQSADKMGNSKFYGAGRVNALKAVERAAKLLNYVER